MSKVHELTHLVVGGGEVGGALYNILKEKWPATQMIRARGEELPQKDFDVIHVCFPYSDDFLEQVEVYRSVYGSLNVLTIIHSSVPVGTTDKIEGAVHSPIRGVHPNLKRGIETFVKYFGGKRCDEAAQIFEFLNIETRTTLLAKNTEHAKLEDTTAYGVMIEHEKDVYERCLQNGTDFSLVYGDFTKTYNEGYTTLGMGYVRRPILKHMPGKIGGHCVIPNCKLLGGDTAQRILEKNDIY